MATLTSISLEQLLERLDTEPARAAEKYELFRLKLVSILRWRGCPESQADALADETLDRVAAKLTRNTEIKNLNAYACKTMRFVWLEHLRKYKEDNYGEDFPVIAVHPETALEIDERIDCLRECLEKVAVEPGDRQMILDYYDAPGEARIMDLRKALARRMGVQMNTLKVRMCRLRERLEKCVNDCVAKRADLQRIGSFAH